MPHPMPIIDEVPLDQMFDDPYPVYRRLRREATVAWLKPANIALITRFDDIIAIEKDHEIFPANDPRSLQIRSMGHSLMRRDGADHAAERKVLLKSFSPGMVNTHWAPIFEQIADTLIDGILARGAADLFRDFAEPMAARCLAEIIGIPDTAPADLLWWSQALIDATGNYADLPEPWARCTRANAAIDAAIEAHAPRW